MDIIHECRCCLSEGLHRDLYQAYTWLDKKEVYADMLNQCFNIVLSSSPYLADVICEPCVALLRAAATFRSNVLQAEGELLKRAADMAAAAKGLLRLSGEKPPQVEEVEIKDEPEDDDRDPDYCPERDHCFRDYGATDDVTTHIEEQTKQTEIEQETGEEGTEPNKRKKVMRRSKRKVSKKNDKPEKKDKKSLEDNIQTLVTRLANISNAKAMPILTVKPLKKKKVTAKVNLSTEKRTPPKKPKPTPDKDGGIDLIWAPRINNVDKYKHKENLMTILQYSNVTPFKNKSILGFICGYCDAKYPDPANLRVHTEIDHKKDRLNFKNHFDMTEFIVKVDVTDLMCTLCDERMENLTSLRQHLVKIHNKIYYSDIKDHILQFKLKKGDVYDCAMCSATYETFKMLKQHMNLHYSNYSCPICDASFATKRSLNAHRATHQDGSFKCDHCEKVFPSKAKKQYHEKTKHLGARNIKNCAFCNTPFRSYYQRNQHLIKVHNTEAQYKCNICDKSYILKSLLMSHIKKSHLMEKNCQCNECGFRFFSKKALKAHMIKHTGERNYQCSVCQKCYARKYTLREHMRIHNNDRRFKCAVCAAAFVQKCSLKSHLLSNHGISMAAGDLKESVQT